MAGKFQLRRGTTAQNNAFTGAVGELTFDTDTNGVRVHDGHTQGGLPFNTVTAFQKPTAGNNYTWYRKWSDGWVEQGGIGTSHQYNTTSQNVTFPVVMKDTKYQVLLTAGESTQQSWDFGVRVGIRYTNGLDVRGGTNSNSAYTGPFFWEVKGMAA